MCMKLWVNLQRAEATERPRVGLGEGLRRSKGEELMKGGWLLVVEIVYKISSHLVVYFVLLHTQKWCNHLTIINIKYWDRYWEYGENQDI